MSEKKSIPDLVLATVRLHAAKAEMDLIRVKDELDRTTVATGRSRVLRGLRDQLTAQRDAWECLAAAASSENHRAVNEAPPAPRVMCTICAHDPHGSDGCGTGCGCDGTGRDPAHYAPHNLYGCSGTFTIGPDGTSRNCTDCGALVPGPVAPAFDPLSTPEAHDAGWDQPLHRVRGCNGAWETGTDGRTRKCADCKGPMDDLGVTP